MKLQLCKFEKLFYIYFIFYYLCLFSFCLQLRSILFNLFLFLSKYVLCLYKFDDPYFHVCFFLFKCSCQFAQIVKIKPVEK